MSGLVYCKVCNKTHASGEGEPSCEPNAWVEMSLHPSDPPGVGHDGDQPDPLPYAVGVIDPDGPTSCIGEMGAEPKQCSMCGHTGLDVISAKVGLPRCFDVYGCKARAEKRSSTPVKAGEPRRACTFCKSVEWKKLVASNDGPGICDTCILEVVETLVRLKPVTA